MSLFLIPGTSLFHVTLRHVLISHPCDMSLFYTPATCPSFTSLQQVSILCPCNMYPFHAPALRVGTIVLSFLAGSVNFIMIMTTIIECGQFNSNSLGKNPKSFQQVILLFNFRFLSKAELKELVDEDKLLTRLGGTVSTSILVILQIKLHSFRFFSFYHQ